MKIKNSFAMHLSGALEKMTFQEGMDFLEGLFEEPVYIMSDFRKIGETEGYKYCGECDFIVTSKLYAKIGNMGNPSRGEDEENLLKRHAIQSVCFRFYLNPTSEEMVEYMDERGEFDFDEDDEDDIAEQFEKHFFDDCKRYIDDDIFEEIDDLVTYWDVVIDEEGHYYRGGKNKLGQHKEYKYKGF